jgi:aryl-alcohol dehydrogenase-like predicted oxidoreductase
MQPSLIAASSTFTLGANTTDPITVRRLGFGAMRSTSAGIWGDLLQHDVAIKALRLAVDFGVAFINTADSCGEPGSIQT